MRTAVSTTRLDLTAFELRRAAKRTDDADAARRITPTLVLECKSRGEAATTCRLDRFVLSESATK